MSAPDASRPSLGALLRASFRGDAEVARSPLRRAIPLLALPMMLETAGEALFSLTDVFFVAKLGAASVATVGLTESLLALVYAIAFGVAMPATAVVARRVGEGDVAAAGQTAAQAAYLALGAGLVLGLSAFAAAPLLELVGASPEVLEVGTHYAVVSLASSPLVCLLFVHGGSLRGAGDAVGVMLALWIANGLNIVLDPFLIFGLGPFPELGVTGAAVATILGRAAGVLFIHWRITRGRMRLRGLPRVRVAIMRELLRLCVGGTAQHLIETGSWVGLVRLLAAFGNEAVAGYTIAMRLILFSLLPVWGFSNATATLVGQSLGAGDPERAERAVWMSGKLAMAILAFMALGFLLVPQSLLRPFSQDPEVLAVGARCLFVIAFGYLFYAWQVVCQQAFNGAGDTMTPALINLACFWVLLLPLAWALANPAGWGPTGVFVSIATSYSVAGVVSVLLVLRGRWKRAVA